VSRPRSNQRSVGLKLTTSPTIMTTGDGSRTSPAAMAASVVTTVS